MIVDPRLNEQSPLHRHPVYSENGCAGGGSLYFRALWFSGLLFVGIVVAAALGSIGAAVIVAIFFLFFIFLAVTSLMTRLPLGIRMDEQGIRIGGVQAEDEGRSRVRRRDKPIQGFTRAMHVYSCDWEALKAIKVLNSPQELALMARGVNAPDDALGVWWANLRLDPWAPGRFIDPKAQGALVFEVETEHASFQATRPPKGRSNANMIYTLPTMTWVIPTKNPAAIKAALAAAQPPVYED